MVPSRVALLVNFIPPYRVSLFRELRARVHELRIFVSTCVEPNRQWPVQWDGLEVAHQRTITINKRWRRPGGFEDQMVVHLPYDTLAQLRRFKPDVVISGELGLRSCLAAAYRRLHPEVKLLIWATLSERTERKRGTVRNLIRPLLFRQADAVLVNGASGGRYVMSQQVPPERIWEIPYTVDVGAFAREPIRRVDPAVQCSLLFVGLLIPRKGVLGLLTALAHWAHVHPERTIEFRIAGDGPQREAVESVPTPVNLKVKLLGNVSYERLPELYRNATILVMPTLEDEWGVVINEGMAAGLPVLGSRYSQAVEELVTDSETGWTFTPDDPNSVNAALDRALAASAGDLGRMSRAARERAMRLTPSAVAERIAGAIDAVRRGNSKVEV
jgi:glycosyltransferase involved in cell wall biosynthesis